MIAISTGIEQGRSARSCLILGEIRFSDTYEYPQESPEFPVSILSSSQFHSKIKIYRLELSSEKIPVGRGFMRIFLWVSLVLILAIAIFVVQNSMGPPLTLKFLLWDFKIFFPYAILGSLGIGILITLSLWIPRALRTSSRVRNLKKEIEALQREKKYQPAEAQEPHKDEAAGDSQSKLHLLWGALKKFDHDHGFFLASGITFNFLICVIPLVLLLLALVASYLYSDQEVLKQVRFYLEDVVPSLDPRIMGIFLAIIEGRKIVGVLGIGGLVWSSTWIFSSLRTALNIIFRVERGRGLLRGVAVDFLLILLAGFLLLLSMTFTSGVTIVQTFHPFQSLGIGPVVEFFLKYLLPFFFTFSMCFLIYKISPNRKVSTEPALKAAFFTSLLWEVAKHIFGWYVLHSTRFSMFYGPLSAIAISFLWIYYSAAILLLGGEIAFLLEEGIEGVPN